jgi:Glycosyl transferase family 11
VSQIIVALAGGLGNQLFQTSAALSLRSSESIYLDQSLGEPRLNSDQLAEIASFQLPDYFNFDSKQKKHKICQRTYRVILRMGLRNKKEKFNVFEKFGILVAEIILSRHFGTKCKIVCNRGVGYSRISKTKKTVLLIGYFQTFKYSEDQNVLVEMSKFRSKHESPSFASVKKLAQKSKPIMIHIRLSDYKNEPTIGVLSKHYFEAAHAALITKHHRECWLFSDEPEEAVGLLPAAIHGNLKVISPKDFSTIETFELMRFGSGLVISNSTFSWWAARLSQIQGRTVIYPSPWFVGQDDPIDLIPSEWFEIKR